MTCTRRAHRAHTRKCTSSARTTTPHRRKQKNTTMTPQGVFHVGARPQLEADNSGSRGRVVATRVRQTFFLGAGSMPKRKKRSAAAKRQKRSTAKPQDAIALLKADHRQV